MITFRYVFAAIMGLIGLVWLAQGTGLLGGSAMSGSSAWAIVGVLLLIGSVLVIWTTRRMTRS